MSENPLKNVSIPVEDHGLHKHSSNVPRLFTTNFFEHLPVYHFHYKKDNRFKIRYSFFNRLTPLPVPALVTGVTRLYGFFVPYESFFKGWYDFDQRTTHNFSDGTSAIISTGRYINMGLLSDVFVADTNLVSEVTSTDTYDIIYVDSLSVTHYYTFHSFGAAIYKVFCALGIPVSFWSGDTRNLNCHKVLAYLRIMYDHFFPLQYVGNTVSKSFMELFNADTASSLHVSERDLLDLVGHVMYGYFDNSWIESCWDTPVAASTLGNSVGNITAFDPTNNAPNQVQGVTNSPSQVASPSSANSKPSNGTPFVGSSPVQGSISTANQVLGVLTQWVIDALQSVNNFVKRHGLSGNRLIENFLSSRGVELPSDVYLESVKFAQYEVPFEIDAVENNSDVNLGELAGRGQTSGKDFSFKYRTRNDGIFMIIQSTLPDSEPMLATDPYALQVSPLDFHHGAFEKLGTDAVPASVLWQGLDGLHNQYVNTQVFGFCKRYYAENVDVPLYFGDFRVITRGSQSLNRYHTFRSLQSYLQNNNYQLAHSYDFLRVGNDASQFGRIFYTNKQDVMVVVARVKGDRWTNALPIGQSYDWDDDEMNRKVVVQSSGNDSN